METKPTDSMRDREPVIIINGVGLSDAQACTLRVALSSFIGDMQEPDALGSDEVGKSIAASYVARGREVQHVMFLNLNKGVVK